MTKRTLPYTLHDGLFLVDDEAWTPDEIEPFVRACRYCEGRFVRFADSGNPTSGGGKTFYCSDDCRRAEKRRRSSSRLWASRRRKAA